MSLTPVHNEPAIYAEKISAIIVADLHIGIEHELFNAGAKIPSKIEEMKNAPAPNSMKKKASHKRMPFRSIHSLCGVNCTINS